MLTGWRRRGGARARRAPPTCPGTPPASRAPCASGPAGCAAPSCCTPEFGRAEGGEGRGGQVDVVSPPPALERAYPAAGSPDTDPLCRLPLSACHYGKNRRGRGQGHPRGEGEGGQGGAHPAMASVGIAVGVVGELGSPNSSFRSALPSTCAQGGSNMFPLSRHGGRAGKRASARRTVGAPWAR